MASYRGGCHEGGRWGSGLGGWGVVVREENMAEQQIGGRGVELSVGCDEWQETSEG